MKRIFKNGILPVLILSLAVSLSACGSKEAASKDSEKIEETESKINIDDIDIDWSRLTGYAFYQDIDYSENGLTSLWASRGQDFELVLMLNIPDDMSNLYYLDDETYKGHQHVKLLRNGEPVTEIENADYDFENHVSVNFEDVRVLRTSNRIVYCASFSYDGSLNDSNYSIQAPDGKEYYIEWQFTDDVDFMEKELDIYATLDGFLWVPSRDFATKRQDELVWDLTGTYISMPIKSERSLVTGNHFIVRDISGGTSIDYAYYTRPSYKLNLNYDILNPWNLTLTLTEDVEGVSEEELLEEIEEKGLYLYMMMNNKEKLEYKVIPISEGSMYSNNEEEDY